MDTRIEQRDDWTRDRCPVCGEPAESVCACILHERYCPAGHIWYRKPDGQAVIVRGYAIEDAPQNR